MSSENELLVGWHKFEAENDDAAIEIAEGLVRQTASQLWQEERLVKHWGLATAGFLNR
jgi:hypothetical protein